MDRETSIDGETVDGVRGVLERSSLLVRLRALAPRLRLALLMKEERVSLGLQPGSATDAALERPGTLSSRSWQPISLTSSVPGRGGRHTGQDRSPPGSPKETLNTQTLRLMFTAGGTRGPFLFGGNPTGVALPGYWPVLSRTIQLCTFI